MKPYYLLLFLLLSFPVLAQQQNFWSDVRFGGGVGLGFGNDSFQLGIAPSAIYQANEYLAFGLGLNYIYSRFGDSKLTAAGGSLITLFNPIPQIQLSGEFEELRVNRKVEFVNGNLEEMYWLPALYVGAGYQTGPVTIGIRYDLLYQTDKSLYANAWLPFIRFYF